MEENKENKLEQDLTTKKEDNSSKVEEIKETKTEVKETETEVKTTTEATKEVKVEVNNDVDLKTETNKPEVKAEVNNDTNIKAETDKTEVKKEVRNEKQYIVSKNKLLECGVQYGHQTQWWNPKMKPFIHFKKNGIHIINLHKTTAGLQNAFAAIEKLVENKKQILFVGTTKQSKEAIKQNAERLDGIFYVDNRWLGGLLTNFKTIKNSVSRMVKLEKLQETNWEGYTKKEGIEFSKELKKLQANLGGIKYMKKLPDAIFVASTKADKIAIMEAKKLNIPVIGVVDTNEDPSIVEFPIPANDDAVKSLALIVTLIFDAVAKVQGKPMLAAYKQNDDDVKFLGYNEEMVRKHNQRKFANNGGYKPRFNKYNNSSNYQGRKPSSNYQGNKPRTTTSGTTSTTNSTTTNTTNVSNSTSTSSVASKPTTTSTEAK